MMHSKGWRPIPDLNPKKSKKKKPDDLSAEIRAIQEEIGSSRRQGAAMTQYRGAPPQAQAPKEKRRHSLSLRQQSQKKRERDGAVSLTKPEAPTPLTESAILTSSETPLTEREVPIAQRWSKVTPPRTQPEVIDLTGED
jgi:hypothetical protein